MNLTPVRFRNSTKYHCNWHMLWKMQPDNKLKNKGHNKNHSQIYEWDEKENVN